MSNFTILKTSIKNTAEYFQLDNIRSSRELFNKHRHKDKHLRSYIQNTYSSVDIIRKAKGGIFWFNADGTYNYRYAQKCKNGCSKCKNL